jgi:hypothetical protein
MKARIPTNATVHLLDDSSLDLELEHDARKP